MPKQGNIKNLFKIAKTYNKFLILEIMKDFIPRKKQEIINIFLEKEPFTIRNTILNAINSLIIDELLIKQDNNRYVITDLPLIPKPKFTPTEQRIIDDLDHDRDAIPEALQQYLEIETTEFNSAIHSLLSKNIIIKTKNHINENVYSLKKEV